MFEAQCECHLRERESQLCRSDNLCAQRTFILCSGLYEAKVAGGWGGVGRAGKNRDLGSPGKGHQFLYSGCASGSPGGRPSSTAIWAPARTGSVTHKAECKVHMWGPFKEQLKNAIKTT